MVDPDSPSSVAEIDEGWDDVAPPAPTSATVSTKPDTQAEAPVPTPAMAEPRSRDEKLAIRASRSAKKSARRAARQAERRAREQANNRAAQNAAASRDARRATQASRKRESKPQPVDTKKSVSSRVARPDETKKTAALGPHKSLLLFVAVAIAVLAALGWFLWMRGS